MTGDSATHVAARRRIPLAPALAAIQAVLMVVTAGPTDVRNVIYGCSALCDTGAQSLSPRIATALGVFMLLLPLVMGAMSRTWMAGVSLSAAPWLLAMLARSGSLLTPYVGLGQTGGRFDLPFWMSPSQLMSLLASGLLFVGLGWLGWVMRRAWEQRDH